MIAEPIAGLRAGTGITLTPSDGHDIWTIATTSTATSNPVIVLAGHAVAH
jgi:hypothetical protein